MYIKINSIYEKISFPFSFSHSLTIEHYLALYGKKERVHQINCTFTRLRDHRILNNEKNGVGEISVLIIGAL